MGLIARSKTNQPKPEPLPAITGRVLIEVRDGRVTLYPVTQSDEETRQLLGAIMDHIADAIRH